MQNVPSAERIRLCETATERQRRLASTLETLQAGDDWITEREGGLGRYFYELLRHLPAAGVNVHGLVAGAPTVTTSTHGVVTAFARTSDPLPRRLWQARKAASQLLAQHPIDLIVSHFALYGAVMPRTRPLVVHFHGPWARESAAEGTASLGVRAKLALEQSVYRRAQRLIVLSQAFRRELVEGYGIDAERVRIVPGGIDTERFQVQQTRAEARMQLGWPLDRPIAVVVRRQVRRMGLEELIDAAKVVVTQRPDWLLLLGGKGPIAGELQQRIEALGLQHHVRLLGRVSDADLPMVYRAADLSVVPSRSLEGFGLITLESLASGTPVLVTPTGGLPEIVAPFAPQCVFDDASAETMAAHLLDALDERMSLPDEAACRSYALRFSWSAIAEQVRAVYEEARR